MRKEIDRAIASAKNSDKKDDSKYKKLFEIPELIALILKYTVDEYEGCSIEEIISYIDKDSTDRRKPVAPIPKIKSNTESKSYAETDVTYDLHFYSGIPDKYIDSINNKQIIVDFELQGEYNSIVPYRARYYMARMISDQLGMYLRDGDYSTLKKVYSIWICYGNVPKEHRNSILKFRIYGTKVVDIGNEISIDLPKNMDLGAIVLVMRDSNYYFEDKKEYRHPLFKYLDGLFYGDIEICKEFLGETIYDKIEGSVKDMSSFTDGFVLEGIKVGEARGEKRGISIGEKRGISIGKEQNTQMIAERLIKQGVLTFDQILTITGLSGEKLKEISKNL